MDWSNWKLDTEVWGNTVIAYIIALATILVVALVVWAALRLVGRRLHKLNRERNLQVFLLVKALESTRLGLMLIVVGALVLQRLSWGANAYPWMQAVFVLALVLQLLVSGNHALTAWSERFSGDEFIDRAAQKTTMKMLLFFGRLFMYVLGALIIVDNLPGVDITALVASLGVGGIAVALAVQSILSDIFASLTITLDKPFVLGDFIIVGDHLGVVENIGLKTTRIRSLSGEQLIFSNADLLSSRIRNFKRMEQRRVAFEIQATYDTPIEKVRKIPGRIKEIIEELEDTRFDRAHFKAHGSHSLDFEIVYYIHGPDYNLYMDRQQAINLAIHEFFEEEGIEFAFPTQTLYLKNDDKKIE
jgi:small-conductance mechanosensitive channel